MNLLKNNGFTAKNAISGSLFAVSNQLNHSCVPNVVFAISQNKIKLSADQDIKAGEELTIKYVNHASYPKRQKELAKDYAFQCRCPKCVQESDKYPKTNKKVEDLLNENYYV